MQFPYILLLDGIARFVPGPFIRELAFEAEADKVRSDGGARGGVAELEVDEKALGSLGEE